MMFFLSDEMPFSSDELLLIGAASGGKAIEDTATGNPLVFLTDIARPLKSLLIPFTPQQEGTGDPSPSNIRPIVPWNGLTVFGGGENLFDNSQLIQTGITLVDGWYAGTRLSFYEAFGKDGKTFDLPQFKESTRYTLTVTGKNDADTNGGWFVIRYTDDSSTTVLKIQGTEETTASATTNAGKTVQSIEFTYPGGGSVNFYVKNIQLEVGTTATAYVPYIPITETDISFPSPVYGGTLDVVSGVLKVEYGFITLDDSVPIALANWRVFEGSSAWLYSLSVVPSDTNQNSSVCDKVKQTAYASIYNGSIGIATNVISGDFGLAIRVPVENLITEEAIHAYLAENPYHVAYKLATPQTVTLTPAQLTALIGNNTIWSDADGSMTAVYFKKA